MSRTASFSKAEILAAISEMDENGSEISVRKVTEYMGGGSPNRLTPIIKEYKQTKQIDSAPELVYKHLSDAADRMWADAMKISKEAWTTERLDANAQIAELEDTNAEVLSINSHLEELIAEKDKLIDELKRDKASAADQIDTINKEAAQNAQLAEQRIQDADQRRANADAKIDMLSSEIRDRDNKIAEKEKNIASVMSEAKDAEKKHRAELADAKNQTDLEVKALKEEIDEMKFQITDKDQKIESAKNALSVVSSERDDYMADLGRAGVQRDALKAEIKSLNRELKATQQMNANLEKIIEKMQAPAPAEKKEGK